MKGYFLLRTFYGGLDGVVYTQVAKHLLPMLAFLPI